MNGRAEIIMAVHVLEEAQRCLNCRIPMCQKGCPIHTPIPKVIELIRGSRMAEAGKMLYENNPLTSICPLVCNHERQCEGHCVLARKGMPVRFSLIERYVSDACLGKLGSDAVPSNGIRAAVVGSGPAGLTIAVVLARKGYQVTIFESKDKIGGVLRYGIPEFILPKSILDDFERYHLRTKSIRIRPNTTIGGAITIENMFEDGYKAIYLGTGTWQPNTLNIKGETLGNVHFGINYLTNPDSYQLGDTINLIGAGNAAMSVARTALRKGVRQVNCFCLTDKPTAARQEVDYAILEGVKFFYNKRPVEIVDEGVIFEDVATFSDGTNTTTESVPGSRRLYAADSTIISVSQGARSRLVNTTQGLKANGLGQLAADEYGRTSRPGIFASGGVVAGTRTIVEAVAHSKMVAEAMDAYMQGYDLEKKLRGFI